MKKNFFLSTVALSLMFFLGSFSFAMADPPGKGVNSPAGDTALAKPWNNPNLSASGSQSSSGGGWNVGSVQGFGLPEAPIMGIIQAILFWLLMMFSVFGVIGFLISGVMYLTAAGDDGQAKTAKNAMKFSMYGIIVGLSGLIVIQAVDALLNGWGFF